MTPHDDCTGGARVAQGKVKHWRAFRIKNGWKCPSMAVFAFVDASRTGK
jgi:hypothetical protein